ncbi:MAG: FtsX-like permease family protein [Acidobacteria bacterium]|nr:FtsX-like permease family protein [Acidobacteriota bacterium]
MRPRQLVLRGLTYYWRTNLAVVLGVATAVAVLAGALLVGDSVRGSLRELVVQRLGRTDQVVLSTGFFREQLAEDLQTDSTFASAFTGIAPLVAVQGFVTEQESGRRAGQVRVYGVDDRFWRFHGIDPVTGPQDRDAYLSPALAERIGAQAGGAILVRVQRPSDVPLESLHGRKDDLGRTLRLSVRAVLDVAALGEFSLQAQQADVLAVFVPLSRLQEEIEVGDRVNALLVSTGPDRTTDAARALEDLVRREADLADVGLTVRALGDRGAIEVGSETGLLDAAQVRAVQQALEGSGMQGRPILTYLANAMRVGNREIPYSLVTAVDLRTVAPSLVDAPIEAEPPIVLNDWAARDLQAEPGETLTMEYSVWEEPGQLVTRTAEFRVAGVVPVETGDPDLAPVFPGISESPTLSGWDPPFPIDLRRIRPEDEAYWERYRTTPKAFVALEAGQRLWGSRYGALTSVRIPAPAEDDLQAASEGYARRLRAGIDPLALGLMVRDVRTDSLAASRGATDFGAYFVYFSTFLVISALLLAALFFKLGVEQRSREVGVLRAVGFDPTAVRRLFMGEGLLLAVAGSAVGVLGALGCAWLMMFGLRTWWVDAVGTDALTLHASAVSLVAGAAGGVAAAMVCIWWTLRSLSRISERSLLLGQLDAGHLPTPQHPRSAPRRLATAALTLTLVGLALITAAVAGLADRAGAFFGGGTALLVASLCVFGALFRRPPRHVLGGRGWRPVSRLGLRNATYRPARSVLSIAVIASATFILIAVDAFRREGTLDTADRRSGVGGYALFVETVLPVVHDPNTREGREALNLFDLDGVTLEPFRLLPGDDASCLNLYEVRNPRILAPRDGFLAAGRFSFRDSLASNDEEAANPWLLLHRPEPDGAIPVIADANSMTYVLHRALGEDIIIARRDGQIRLRLVAALRDSIFQGELLMSQANFRELFPEQEGSRVLLVEMAPERAAAVGAQIEDALVDYGADVTSTAAKLAEFHRVENTYLSTFQTLGGLGLLLGTVGLATVLLRNVLERRRELALLGAVGYRRAHFMLMVAAENTLLLVGGLAAGAVCAGLAIAPAVAERGGRVPLTSGGALLLFAVLVIGLLSSLVATRLATRGPLLESLRAE